MKFRFSYCNSLIEYMHHTGIIQACKYKQSLVNLLVSNFDTTSKIDERSTKVCNNLKIVGLCFAAHRSTNKCDHRLINQNCFYC